MPPSSPSPPFVGNADPLPRPGVDFGINYSYFLFFCGGWEEQVLLKTKGVAIDRHRWVTRKAWVNGEHMGKGAMAGRSTDDLMVRGGYGYLQQSQVRDASNPPRV